MNNMRNKILSLLVLLLTAATGAWADEVTIGSLNGAGNNSYLPMNSLYNYSFTEQIYTADEIGMEGTINAITLWMYGNENLYEIPFDIYMVEVDKDAFESTTDWVPLTESDKVYSGNVTVHNAEAQAYTFTLSTPFEYSGTKNLLIAFNNKTGNWKSGLNGMVFGANGDPVRAIYARRDNGGSYDIANPGAATDRTYSRNVVELEITPTTGLEVTTNAKEEGDCFTEASFTMPASDATVKFKMVRDMEYKVNAYVGDNADATYRHRVELVGNNIYKPMGITNNAQITALFNVVDYIDAENPKTLVYGTDFTVAIVDKDENETNAAEFNFAPGTYTVKIIGKGNYDGVIDSQNAFWLYLGVDITVPAGELVTYYSDETLYTEEEDAEIYTITDVSGTEATATELTIVPANTPFLVKNTADEKKTFLFIVTDGDQLPAVNYYPGFTGTLNATTIDASTADQTNYAFNGKEFVYVKNAIRIGAHKAWLEVANANARALTIVFGEATGVESVELRTENGEFATATWYTIDGRKIAAPTKKGIYILNGKKVVVK